MANRLTKGQRMQVPKKLSCATIVWSKENHVRVFFLCILLSDHGCGIGRVWSDQRGQMEGY